MPPVNPPEHKLDSAYPDGVRWEKLCVDQGPHQHQVPTGFHTGFEKMHQMSCVSSGSWRKSCNKERRHQLLGGEPEESLFLRELIRNRPFLADNLSKCWGKYLLQRGRPEAHWLPEKKETDWHIALESRHLRLLWLGGIWKLHLASGPAWQKGEKTLSRGFTGSRQCLWLSSSQSPVDRLQLLGSSSSHNPRWRLLQRHSALSDNSWEHHSLATPGDQSHGWVLQLPAGLHLGLWGDHAGFVMGG